MGFVAAIILLVGTVVPAAMWQSDSRVVKAAAVILATIAIAVFVILVAPELSAMTRRDWELLICTVTVFFLFSWLRKIYGVLAAIRHLLEKYTAENTRELAALHSEIETIRDWLREIHNLVWLAERDRKKPETT